jgi:hypothetical protein
VLGRWKVRACSRGVVELKWSAGLPTWVMLVVWALLVAGGVWWMVAALGAGFGQGLFWPIILIIVATTAAVPAFISALQNVWTIGTVQLRDGIAEAEYLGPGRLADVRTRSPGPVKVQDEPGSRKETRRRVIATAPDGSEIPLGPWLPPSEAFRMVECLNRGHSAKRTIR